MKYMNYNMKPNYSRPKGISVSIFSYKDSDSEHHRGSVVIERPPREWEVAGSISNRVIPNTSKMVVVAALLGALGCGLALRLNGRRQDK